VSGKEMALAMNLNNFRKEIDNIDDEILALFIKRMKAVKEIADFKKANNLPVLNSGREDDIINRLCLNSDDNMKEYIKKLFSTIFDISRIYQNDILKSNKR